MLQQVREIPVADGPDALPTMSGVEVLRAVREFSPRTRLAAQVESELALPALLALVHV